MFGEKLRLIEQGENIHKHINMFWHREKSRMAHLHERTMPECEQITGSSFSVQRWKQLKKVHRQHIY